MPIYEYQCRQCGHQDSELDSINAPRLKKCPECGKRAFERLISAAAFHLKGGGWYETDFKKKSADKSVEKAEKEKNASDKKDAAKTDKAGEKADKKSDKKEGGDSSTKAETKEKSAKNTAAKKGDSKSKSGGK
ncbi:MAG: FmdB family zinc ribbon protein [Gammaproteobacteria bacterium WSBS_2016_MAG_OTU1]